MNNTIYRMRATRCCSCCGQAGHNRRTCMTSLSKEWITNTVPKLLGGDIVLKNQAPMCMICMDTVNCSENNVMTLPCGHTYHVTCGLKWFQEHNTCPSCREECGEKNKKIPLLTPAVATDLIQYRIMGINFQDTLREMKIILITPWLTDKFKSLLDWNKAGPWDLVTELSKETLNIIENSYSYVNTDQVEQHFTNESLKNIWDELSENTRNKNIQEWLLGLMHINTFNGMYNILADAYRFQEIGTSIPGDESSWSAMSPSITPTEINDDEDDIIGEMIDAVLSEEDDGVQDDGVQDDGVQDDGVQDDGVQDGGLQSTLLEPETIQLLQGLTNRLNSVSAEERHSLVSSLVRGIERIENE